MSRAAAPTVLSVTASQPGRLQIEWSTGETLQTDIGEQIERFKLLHSLRDPERFAQAAPGLWGHSVTWGDDVDMSANLLYGLGCEQAGRAAPVGFDALQQRMLTDERERNICQRRHEEKRQQWFHALDVWKAGGALHPFLLGQFAGLKDRDGDELPYEVRQFLLDLVRMKEPKPPKLSTGYVIPRHFAQAVYREALFYYRSPYGGKSKLLQGESPSSRAVEEAAEKLRQKESWVQSMVSTRKPRKNSEKP